MPKQSIDVLTTIKEIVQIQNAIQGLRESKKHQELYWSTFPQGLHLVFLPTSKKFTQELPSSNNTITINSCTLLEQHLCTL